MHAWTVVPSLVKNSLLSFAFLSEVIYTTTSQQNKNTTQQQAVVGSNYGTCKLPSEQCNTGPTHQLSLSLSLTHTHTHTHIQAWQV